MRFVVLKGIEYGNVFITQDTGGDPRLLVDGTVAYEVLGRDLSETEAQRIWQSAFVQEFGPVTLTNALMHATIAGVSLRVGDTAKATKAIESVEEILQLLLVGEIEKARGCPQPPAR